MRPVLLVLAPGPSLLEHMDVIINSANVINAARASGMLKVVCIKSTVNEFIDICDYHIYNNMRFDEKSVTHKKDGLVRIYGGPPHPLEVYADKIIRIDFGRGLRDTMAQSGDFKSLDNAYKNGIVSWGPGILYDTVLPLAVEIKCSDIVFVGWDMFPHGTLAAEWNVYYKYYTGALGENTLHNVTESTIITLNSNLAYRYMRDVHGTNMSILATDNSHVSKEIPRISHNEFFQKIKTCSVENIDVII
jgi:hypothetical protein